MQKIIASLRDRSMLILVAIVALSITALWLRGNHYREGRDLWRSTARTQADATRTAMAAAAIRAETARLETERRYAAHARKADHEEPPAIVDLRHAADRYADARRLRGQTAADCRVPGSPATTAQTGPAPDRDGPGADALGEAAGEMITIPRRAFDQFTDNTLRLEKVRVWGEGLITDGLAVGKEPIDP